MLAGFEDDLIYLQILVVSFIFALVVKRLPKRDGYAGAFGLLLVFVVCGDQILYSLVIVLINLLLIHLIKDRNLPLYSFAATFLYLGFFRSAHFLGLPKRLPHANAIQLIITLRCIGLCYEIADSRAAKKRGVDPVVDSKRHIREPNLVQAFLYLYNFAGLFTGPYYSYQMHYDMVRATNLPSLRFWPEVVPRLTLLLVFVPLLLLVAYTFPLAAVLTDEFYEEHNFFTRILYMAPIFIFLRMRVYCAWMLSESACIANGIGAYPEKSKPKTGSGPTNLPEFRQHRNSDDERHSFEAIKNLDIMEVEFSDGFRTGMRHWNKSVQFWLANYVYHRSPKAIRMPFTMLVSAFWHGIHPGYYLSFLTVPLCTYAEDLAFSTFRPRRQRRSSVGSSSAAAPAMSSSGSAAAPAMSSSGSAAAAMSSSSEAAAAMSSSGSAAAPAMSSSGSAAAAAAAMSSSSSAADASTTLYNNTNNNKMFAVAWWFLRMRAFEYMAMGFLLLTFQDTIRFWCSIGFCVHVVIALVIGLALANKKMGWYRPPKSKVQ